MHTALKRLTCLCSALVRPVELPIMRRPGAPRPRGRASVTSCERMRERCAEKKPRFPFDAQDLDEALKDHAVNGRSSPWPNKRGHHFFMAVLRSFLALCVLGEAFGTLLNFSEKVNLSAKLTIYLSLLANGKKSVR